eukprot:1290298-Prymnesium_polylepis.1
MTRASGVDCEILRSEGVPPSAAAPPSQPGGAIWSGSLQQRREAKFAWVTVGHSEAAGDICSGGGPQTGATAKRWLRQTRERRAGRARASLAASAYLRSKSTSSSIIASTSESIESSETRPDSRADCPQRACKPHSMGCECSTVAQRSSLGAEMQGRRRRGGDAGAETQGSKRHGLIRRGDAGAEMQGSKRH